MLYNVEGLADRPRSCRPRHFAKKSWNGAPHNTAGVPGFRRLDCCVCWVVDKYGMPRCPVHWVTFALTHQEYAVTCSTHVTITGTKAYARFPSALGVLAMGVPMWANSRQSFSVHFLHATQGTGPHRCDPS